MLNGACVENVLHPMSCGHVRVADLGLALAEDLHRAEERPLGTARAERRWALGHRLGQHRGDALLVLDEPPVALGDRGAGHAARGGAREELREPAHDEARDVLAVRRQEVLAVDLDVEARLVRERLQLALDVVRHPLLDHEDAALAAHEGDELLRHQRVQAVEDQQRHGRAAVDVRHAQLGEPAHRRVPQPALHDDPELAVVAVVHFVQRVVDDVAPRRGQALLELLRLHGVGERRQVDAVDREARRGRAATAG